MAQECGFCCCYYQLTEEVVSSISRNKAIREEPFCLAYESVQDGIDLYFAGLVIVQQNHQVKDDLPLTIVL